MKSITTRIMPLIIFMIMAFSVTSSLFAASAVKPLNVDKIKGKPSIHYIRDEEENRVGNIETVRLMELLRIGKLSGKVDISKLAYRPINNNALCALAIRHLTKAAKKKVLHKEERRCWAGRNRLEREDAQRLFEKKYLPQIKKAAVKIASHKAFRELIVVSGFRITPDHYFREKKGFIFCNSLQAIGCGLNADESSAPMLAIADFKRPEVWKISESKARKLMNGELSTSRGQILQIEKVIEIGDVKRNHKGQYYIEGRINSLAIYSSKDKDLKKPLYRYAKSDFTDTAKIEARQARAGEKSRLSKLKKIKLADAKYFTAAYDKLSKNSSASVRNKEVWVNGGITLNTYNTSGSYFPLKSLKLFAGEHNKSKESQWGRTRFVSGQIKNLPIPADIAKRISKPFGGIFVGKFRALVKPVKANKQTYTLELAVVRLEILDGLNQNITILDDKNVIFRFTPKDYKTLVADASTKKAKAGDDIAIQLEACKTSDNPATCYSTACQKVRKINGYKAWESCMKDAKPIIRKWKRNASKAFNEKDKEKRDKRAKKAATESSCRRKYVDYGYGVQPWMPVKGTPEYKSAMKACQNEVARNDYGPDILGLRLGMKLKDTRDYISRQSMKYSTSLKDTRPFEKATLTWSEDANHGIAIFSVVNGEHERVAAVSRRLYFSDKAPTVKQVTSGLTKKYGSTLWTKGKNTLVWATANGKGKPSAKKCSGLAALVEPRMGWKREWINKKTRREERKQQRREKSMSKVAPQQACIAKHGMPTGPADMQILARCIQESSSIPSAMPTTTKESKSSARLPFMIKNDGSQKLYSDYGSCGAVTIAYINTDSKGVVKDMSVMLFDPSWVADQPKFAFQKGDGTAQINF